MKPNAAYAATYKLHFGPPVKVFAWVSRSREKKEVEKIRRYEIEKSEGFETLYVC
ncbi:MAG: hypothetical protein PVH61_10665 [Candidatus Aminicenantes bacterium]|jgi:hypothetical protein